MNAAHSSPFSPPLPPSRWPAPPQAASSAGGRADAPPPGFALIPAGSFEMGDHHGFVDPKHGGDETPIHNVRLDAFYMGIFDVTTEQYREFLNCGDGRRVDRGADRAACTLPGKSDLLAETRAMSPYSRIGWDGARFTVLDGKERHPWSASAGPARPPTATG